MDYSVTFARHFSRLVWLLLHEPQNVDEQKAALRAVNTVSKDGPVTLGTREWRLVVNGAQLPEALTGVQDLAAQLIGHAVIELHFSTATPPAELLGVARILAGEPTPGDGGAAVQAKLGALGATAVVARVRGANNLVKLTPVGIPMSIPAPGGEDDPGLSELVEPEEAARALFAPGPPDEGIVPQLRHTLAVQAVPEPPKYAPPAAAAAAAPVKPVTPPRGAQPAPVETTPVAAVPGDDDRTRNSGAFLTFAAASTPSGSARGVLMKLDGATSVAVVTKFLDELVTLTEAAQRDGKSEQVADLFAELVEREARHEGDVKRAFVMAVRRLSKPVILRGIAQLLPRSRENVDRYRAVLIRAGEDGADALIEQLINAPSLAERRIYFDTLAKLHAGVPALIHMLSDARWYVARNAADLLGEMQAPEAEQPLAEMLKHDDDRVRRAAATALAKLGTPKALLALHNALKDSSPQVRLQAVSGLSARRAEKTSATLVRALDEEGDSEVQLEILRGLGRLGTADAVQKLIRAAEADGRFFRKKSIAFRVAAVHALAEARSSAAMATLQSLANDREKEVREAVVRALVAGQGRSE
jgi:hypothetical protein